MADHYDELVCAIWSGTRRRFVCARFPAVVEAASLGVWLAIASGDGRSLTASATGAALARLSVLRKSDLPALQKAGAGVRWFRPRTGLARSVKPVPSPVRSSSLKPLDRTHGVARARFSPRDFALATSC